MTKLLRSLLILLVALAPVAAESARAADTRLHGWPAPRPAAVRTLADVGPPEPFVGLPPCRIVDTRGGAPLTGGFLPAATPRNYTLAGQCGVPFSATALSVNLTVTNTAGPGYITIYPAGGMQPTVSTLNYAASQTIANAAIVALPANGTVTVVAGVSGTDLIVDVNGYFTYAPASGEGMELDSNGSGYTLFAQNLASTCGTTCGAIFGKALAGNNGLSAITGIATSTVGENYGVFGQSDGTGSPLANASNSAGVYGLATSDHAPVSGVQGVSSAPTNANYGVYGQSRGNGSHGSVARLPSVANSAGVFGEATSTTDIVSGVQGRTVSAALFAAGVYGEATAASANGGVFINRAGGVWALSLLGTYGSSGQPVGLATNGDIQGNNLSISGNKSFIAPHPDDPSKEINYVAVEAPSADVTFRGTARLAGGVARIPIPDHFRATAREGSYTTIATAMGSDPVPLAVEQEGPDGIVVRGRRDVDFHFVVTAERDALRDHEPVQRNVHFTPEAMEKVQLLGTLPKGVREALVKNGTLAPDGTYDERTAARMGWRLPAKP